MSQSKIENFWYSQSLLKWLFWPFSFIVLIAARLKRFFYKIKLFKTHYFSCPIIVVGNITVGGTGKTPFITFLIKRLQQKKLKIGIVSRGYRSNLKNYPHLIDNKDKVEEIGDEVFMQFHALNVPMAIGADRPAAVNLLLKHHSLDLIISDDGLQHYAMSRNFEILMVDAQRQFGNQLMLPFGPLREPVSRLRTTDFIIQNGVASLDTTDESTASMIQKQNVQYATLSLEVIGLIHLVSGESIALSNLKESKVVAIAGIGNPQRFFDTLADFCTGFERRVFADHHQFTPQDFPNNESKIVVMTEKDAVKCMGFAKNNWYFLKIKVALKNSDFDKLYQQIKFKCSL